MNSIFTRRSIRKYKDQPIEPEKLDRILRAAMQAPSAHNTQPWQFMVLTDFELKRKISELSPYAKPALHAPVLIIPMGDMEKTKEGPHQWWQESLAAATQNTLLQATEEGLGSLWMGYFPDADRVKGVQKVLQLPETIIPYSVICIGYGETENKFVDRYDESRVHYNQY